LSNQPQKIIISRTDSIGDVILTLPLAGIIKQHHPNSHISFLGKTYTKSVIECCTHVDEFLNWDEIQKTGFTKSYDAIIHVFPNKAVAKLAKQSKIKIRIGTFNRWFHHLYCNKTVKFSRRTSDLHEAQLNTKLLKPLGIESDFSLTDLANNYGFKIAVTKLPKNINNLLNSEKKKVILHPKSQGSAAEWGVANFMQLASELANNNCEVLITGTQKEAKSFNNLVPQNTNIHNLAGTVSLQQFIYLISKSDSLVAASTGPLHIAAFSGIQAIGLYSTKKPIHPGRWSPIGKNTQVIVANQNELPGIEKELATDITEIKVKQVLNAIL
jgi:ADP-heptose:LPS heptosyltransferase